MLEQVSVVQQLSTGFADFHDIKHCYDLQLDYLLWDLFRQKVILG